MSETVQTLSSEEFANAQEAARRLVTSIGRKGTISLPEQAAYDLAIPLLLSATFEEAMKESDRLNPIIYIALIRATLLRSSQTGQ